MIVAHVAGLPIEEVLFPALSAGASALLVGLRALLRDRRRSTTRSRGAVQRASSGSAA